MKAVYKRELASYFNSMIGYVFVAIVSAFIGLYFVVYNLKMGHPYFAASLGSSIAVFIFAIPVLTMRSMAEERKTKTDQLLLTYPVSVTSVVFGKFLAMMTVYAVPLLIGCLCPIVIALNGTGSFLIDYSSILLFLCMGAMFVALGMFVSSLTESQVIAAVVTMAALLLIVIWDSITGYVPQSALSSLIGFSAIFLVAALLIYRAVRSWVAPAIIFAAGTVASAVCYFAASDWFSGALTGFLKTVSIYDTLSNFVSYYTFDIKGIVSLLSYAAVFVFLTIQAVQRRRWV